MENILSVGGVEVYVSDAGKRVWDVLAAHEALTIPNVASSARCTWKTAAKWLDFYTVFGYAKMYRQQYRPNITRRVYIMVKK